MERWCYVFIQIFLFKNISIRLAHFVAAGGCCSPFDAFSFLFFLNSGKLFRGVFFKENGRYSEFFL